MHHLFIFSSWLLYMRQIQQEQNEKVPVRVLAKLRPLEREEASPRHPEKLGVGDSEESVRISKVFLANYLPPTGSLVIYQVSWIRRLDGKSTGKWSALSGAY